MWALKLAMSWLPNIEPVSLLILVYTAVLGKKVFYPVYVFVALDVLLYGLGLWNIMYLYVWALLALAAMGLGKDPKPIACALLSGAFGLLFGALCAPVDVFIGGWAYAGAKWVSGIPFDISHCIGNFTLAFLFSPLKTLLARLCRRTV